MYNVKIPYVILTIRRASILYIYLQFIYKTLLLGEKNGRSNSSTTTTAVVFRTKALNMGFGCRLKQI